MKRITEMKVLQLGRERLGGHIGTSEGCPVLLQEKLNGGQPYTNTLSPEQVAEQLSDVVVHNPYDSTFWLKK